MSYPVKVNIGDKYNHLTIIGKSNRTDKYNREYYFCICDCGNPNILEIEKIRITGGYTKSCGCERIRNNKKYITHGLSGTKIYNKYCGMIDRCYDSNSSNYYDYGGRGISVCREWYNPNYKNGHDPECVLNFYNWAISNGWNDNLNLSIDRVDPNGNYEPKNCRLIPLEYQSNNRRISKYLTIDEETYTLSDWSRITGINYASIKNRSKNKNYITDKEKLFGKDNKYIINALYTFDMYGRPIPVTNETILPE